MGRPRPPTLQRAVLADRPRRFAATRTGKPWAHQSCYENCKAVLIEAGFPAASPGDFEAVLSIALGLNGGASAPPEDEEEEDNDDDEFPL